MTRKSKHIKHTTPPPGKIAQQKAPAWQWLLILFIPFGLYINTLSHDYALDDAIVFTENQFTQQGFAGIDDILTKETFVGYFGEQKDLVAGGRYRPLSLVTFAIEVELFGNNPFIGHFINILLYALTGLGIYFLFFRLFQFRWQHLLNTVPFLTAIFFIVHPVHTEAVANIKGRDEILAMLLTVGAAYYLLRSIKENKTLNLSLSVAAFFLALLAKENSYTWIFIIPALLYVFTQLTYKKIAIYSSFYIGIVVVALLIRQAVIGGLAVSGNQDLMNDPFVQATLSQKFATIFYTLGYYLKLLIFPYPLTHDYYPYHIPLMNWDNPLVLLSLIAYILLAIYSIYGIFKKNLLALGIWIYLIPLSVVSNIVFPVGTFMSERFIFMPSLGFGLLLALVVVTASAKLKSASTVSAENIGLWIREMKQKYMAGTVLAATIIVIFSVLTILRNPVWANNKTLFLTDVNHSPNSAKINNAAGGVLYDSSQVVQDPQLKQQLWSQSRQYLERAVEIYPGYSAAWTTLGNIYYFQDKDFNKTLWAYANAGDAKAMNNLFILSQDVAQRGDINAAQQGYRTLIRYNHRIDEANMQLGMIQGKFLGNLDSAIIYFNRAAAVNPNNPEVLENLGVAYGFKNQHTQALEYFQRALQFKSNDPNLHQNLANTYNALGDIQKAQTHQQRANLLRQGG